MEQAEEASVKTLSDDEFDPNQFEDEYDKDENNCKKENDGDEWETFSQISGITSETSTSTASSSVWIYFDKNPEYAQGYNVCKSCSKKYQLSTSVTTLRKHLEKQIKSAYKNRKKRKKKR